MSAAFRVDPDQFVDGFREGSIISPQIYCERLGISGIRLAKLAGVHRSTVVHAPASEELQGYLGDSLSVLTMLVEANGGDVERAVYWFRNMPLIELGGETAERYVSQGKVRAVRCYASGLSAGAIG
ncbi:hypothetical protein NSY55_26690 [Pseudomonas aeruginosa]|nr:hypothetical protein [Pseudomonas aeruginosa]